VVEECRSLEVGSGVAKWDPLPSPSPHVSLSMRLGDNGGVMGKAETVFDCSAFDATARRCYTCGREEMQLARDAGDPCMLMDEPTAHDITWCFVKHLPFPLAPRECAVRERTPPPFPSFSLTLSRSRRYVGRQICFADAAGSLHICNAPRADIQVDYGERRTLVRASSTVFWRATPLPGDTQCKIVVMVCSDLKGWVPSFAAVREKLARMPLLKTARGREQFNRDAEVDGDERELLAQRMR
jgi:hypothetical protein